MGRRPPLSSSERSMKFPTFRRVRRKRKANVFLIMIGQAMDFHYLASISMPAIHVKTNAKVIKRNETGKLSRDYFLTYYYFLGKWHVFPFCLFSHIKVFSRKKSQSLIFRLICYLYYWCTTHYKNDTFRFILHKVSSKYHYFCRSIIKSPWCIIK